MSAAAELPCTHICAYCFSGLCHSDLTVDVMPGPVRFNFISPRNVMPEAASTPHRVAPAERTPTSWRCFQ